MKSLGDRLTTHKLYLEATGLATKILSEEFESAQKAESDERPLLLKQVGDAREKLQSLIKDMQAFLDGGNSGK